MAPEESLPDRRATTTAIITNMYILTSSKRIADVDNRDCVPAIH
jgi:hypothetical protein